MPKSYKQVETFARAVGRQPNIVQYYSGWWEPFRAGLAQRTAHARGATVFVDIDPYGVPVAGIAAGDNDTYLTDFARAVHKFGHRVIISFGDTSRTASGIRGDTPIPRQRPGSRPGATS